jgi:hypothetical protein
MVGFLRSNKEILFLGLITAAMLAYFIIARPVMMDDGFHYEGFAETLAHGRLDFKDFYGFQGLSILSVSVFWLTGSHDSIIITSAVLSLLSIWLAYAVGRDYHGNKKSGLYFALLFLLSQAVVRHMMKKGGSIINITSLGAETGFSNNPAYMASKGGLKLLTKAFAKDWAKYNIRVNNIGPGYIRTDMTRKSYADPELKRKRDERIMLNRWGKPDDLGGAAVFLASDASLYITGQDIYVDGGWLANGV